MSLSIPDAVIPDVTSLHQDSDDRIWVGTQAHGAWVIEAGVPRAVRESGAVSTLQNESVTSIEESMPGEVWLGTEGGGVVALDTRSGTTRRIRHEADTPTSLSDNNIAALYRDKSNLMWVATDQATSQGDPGQRGVVMLLGATGRPNGIRGTNVYSVLRMPDGRIWLSGADGIDIVDPTLGRIGQLLPDTATPDTALPKGRIRAMVVLMAAARFTLARRRGCIAVTVRVSTHGPPESAGTWSSRSCLPPCTSTGACCGSGACSMAFGPSI